jgi:HD superfamily phosphodiesterase
MERIIEKKEDIIHDVVSIITTMSFKAGTNKVKQTTLEGKIVQDADY